MLRAKPGDHERALALLAATADTKVTKARLVELRDATAAHDESRQKAEAANIAAMQGYEMAREAEAAARAQSEALADESAEAQATLGKRETAVAERERIAGEVEKSQDARDADLKRREEHLSEAGVRGF